MPPFDELSGEELDFNNTESNDDLTEWLDESQAGATSTNQAAPQGHTGHVVAQSGRFSEECRNDLDSWFWANVWSPYPSDAVLQLFNFRWGLTREQLKTYFMNLRQRFSAAYPFLKAVWEFWAPLRWQSTYSRNT
jgi:hypothetical protein